MTPAERMKLMDAICRQSAASLRNMALKLTLLSDLATIAEKSPSLQSKHDYLDAVDDFAVTLAAHLL